MGRTDDDRFRPAAPLAEFPLVARLQDARTALNAIRGFSELMLAGGAGPLSADGLDYMRQIAAAGRLLEEALSMVATENGPPCGRGARCRDRSGNGAADGA